MPTNERKIIAQLLKNPDIAIHAAERQYRAYYAGIGKTPPAFLTAEETNATVARSAREEKIAVNLAGFYALECGLDYLASRDSRLPSEILKSIVNGTIDDGDKQLLCRFANATWKAGQPFRGLERITRDIFKPFDLLSPEEKEKDWVQLQTAAATLSALL